MNRKPQTSGLRNPMTIARVRQQLMSLVYYNAIEFMSVINLADKLSKAIAASRFRDDDDDVGKTIIISYCFMTAHRFN
ncbi:MAG: hypothetical protein E6J34_20600 [Chloroflexi bacterium]|nr:MAG: hypothetical protein E6J34_20600 [Chloroflexota bacterium]